MLITAVQRSESVLYIYIYIKPLFLRFFFHVGHYRAQVEFVVLDSRFLPAIYFMYSSVLGFPGGSVEKNQPAMQKTWVRSLGQEDPLEKEMGTHSNILAWEIP